MNINPFSSFGEVGYRILFTNLYSWKRESFYSFQIHCCVGESLIKLIITSHSMVLPPLFVCCFFSFFPFCNPSIEVGWSLSSNQLFKIFPCSLHFISNSVSIYVCVYMCMYYVDNIVLYKLLN